MSEQAAGTASPSAVRRAPRDATGGRVAAWAWTLGPPLVALAVVRVAYSVVTGTDVWSEEPETWARWDSGNYETIAADGYAWDDCPAPDGGTMVCTNVAWYPLYPYLARALMAVTPLDVSHALIAVSHAAVVGMLVVLWRGFLGPRPTTRGLSALALAAVFPGGVYHHGEFPVSLLCLLLLVQVWCFRRRRWWWGATAGALAGLCYPIAVVLAPASAAWVVLADRAEGGGEGAGGVRRAWWSPGVWRAVGVGAVVSLGTLGVFALHEMVLGRAQASLDAQRQVFRSTPVWPWVQWWEVVVERSSWLQWLEPDLAGLLAAQTALVAVLVAAAVGVAAAATRRHGWRTAVDDLGLAMVLVLLWLLPLANRADTGLYRREATLLPVVVLLARLPAWALAPLVAVAAAIWLPMADEFFRYVLV